MSTPSVIKKNKNSKAKKGQHVTLRLAQSTTADFTPSKFNSKSVKLIPTNIIKAVEFLLYYKPTMNRMGFEGLVNSGGSSNVLVKSNIFKNAIGRSIITLNEGVRKGKGFDFLQTFTSMTGIGKQIVGIGSVRSEELDSIPRSTSLFRLRTDPWPTRKPRTKSFKIVIRETRTLMLHSYQSRAAIEGTEQAKIINEHNEAYWNSVRTYKKMYNAEAQTPSPMVANRLVSMKSRKSRIDSKIQVSYSDIYDSNVIKRETVDESATCLLRNEESSLMRQSKSSNIMNDIQNMKSARVSTDELNDFSEATKIVSIVESPDFMHSFVTLLRSVDRTVNYNKQMIFRKGSDLDPLADKCSITYDIKHLWTLRFLKVWGMPVTSLCINPVNANIVAVGHGMYFLDQPQHLGRVCIWNLKNCSHPEKHVEFPDGITCISFSRKHPFALLVSFIKGGVKILDISKPKIEVLASFSCDSSIEPIWHVKWFTFDSGNEEPIACGEKGNVYLFLKETFTKKIFVTLCRKEGVMKGIRLPKHCRRPMPVTNKPSVTCIATNPDNCYSYLVGTDDGCVHLCSTDYYHEHTDVFQAHIGPVHHIKYHPDCSKIFLTVGIDYCVRIWAYGVFQPLVYLLENECSVEDADWSPVNPNIIVTVGSNKVFIFDISRLKLMSQSSITSPTGSRFTSVMFTANGSNLICGDLSGDVHVYALSHMPFRYFNKTSVLRRTFKRLLLGKKDLYDKLRSLGYPFDSV